MNFWENLVNIKKIWKSETKNTRLLVFGIFLASAVASLLVIGVLGRVATNRGRVALSNGERVVNLQKEMNDFVEKNKGIEFSVNVYDLNNGVMVAEHKGDELYKIPELVDFVVAFDSYNKFSNKFFNTDSKIVGELTRKNCVEEMFVKRNVACRDGLLKDIGSQILLTSMRKYYNMFESDLENYTTKNIANLMRKMIVKNNIEEGLSIELKQVLSKGLAEVDSGVKSQFGNFEIIGRMGEKYLVLGLNRVKRWYGVVLMGNNIRQVNGFKELVKRL